MPTAKKSFEIRRTDHTSFTVRDLDEALGFWVGVLGFELLQRHIYAAQSVERLTGVPGSDIDVAVVIVPGHRIELIQYLKPPVESDAPRTSSNIGAAHVAFEVERLDDLLDTLKGSAWTPGGEPLVVKSGPRQGHKAIYVRHPDGMTIEFIQA